MSYSNLVTTLAFFILGIILFVFLAKALPHNQSLEQTQQWKIAILSGLFAFGLISFIIVAIWLFDIVQTSSVGSFLSIKIVLASLVQAINLSGTSGIYLAIIILLLTYWRISFAPWSLYDLQTGASVFDSLVEHIRKIFHWVRRAG